MTCLLGADLGTTNVKLLAVSPDNWKILAHSSVEVPTLSPQPGYAEQDPEAVWNAVQQTLTEVVISVQRQQISIDAVSFSAGMHSLLAVDQDGKPLTNALLWSDNRAQAQAADLHAGQVELGNDIYAHTGTPIHPMIPLCKLAWFRANQPDLLTKAVKWISLKEYIWWKLTGRYDIDYSIATATGLFDEKMRNWYQPSLNYAGIRPDQLSDLQPTTFSIVYDAERPGAMKTSLPSGVHLFPGASDGCLANLGAGSIGPGITNITIGTSGAVRRTVNQPLRDPNGRLFCYFLDERNGTPYYVVGGPSNNGANVLQWLEEKLTHQDTDVVLAQAQQIPAGSDGLLFLPYLHGERAPLWDSSARGAYLNVDYRHSRAHFIRASLEGVLFNLLSIEELVTSLNGPSKEIYANGGFAQSAFWVQMMADVFGIPVRLNASNESSAMGAVLLVSDTHQPLDKLADEVLFGETFTPNSAQHEIYQKVFEHWKNAVSKR